MGTEAQPLEESGQRSLEGETATLKKKRSFWRLQGGFLGLGGQGGEDFREIFLGGCF